MSFLGALELFVLAGFRFLFFLATVLSLSFKPLFDLHAAKKKNDHIGIRKV